MTSDYVLAIDQGTTSSRAIIFDDQLQIKASSQQEITQHFPEPGWVEHDPDEIWDTTLATVKQSITKAGLALRDIAAIGIANQRETVIIWDKATGKPIYPAIVWQDRRTAGLCQKLRRDGVEAIVAKSGLTLDPYFSASKIAWILDNIDGARQAANAGKLAFGTIDSFLLWRLTDGGVHACDITNASRTMLYDIFVCDWSDELLELFNIPKQILPEVRECTADFGVVARGVLPSCVKITGIAGDQQAALIGQGCFSKGMLKATYGSGCFALLNIGDKPVLSGNRLLTSVGYKINDKLSYVIEGSIFAAGTTLQWLRDGLKIIDHASQSDELAAAAAGNHGVYLVPAFTGLGAPYWDSECRGAIFGLTRDAGKAEIAAAALASVGYQTLDLLKAMTEDGIVIDDVNLMVDGAMAASKYGMQFLADITNKTVAIPRILETTALGAAYLAGISDGIYPDIADFDRLKHLAMNYYPDMSENERQVKYSGWREAVSRTLIKNDA